jgi:hypothetical protein
MATNASVLISVFTSEGGGGQPELTSMISGKKSKTSAEQ